MKTESTVYTWEFLNSDGHWVHCIGGRDHADEAARNDGPGKYRLVTTTTETEEYSV